MSINIQSLMSKHENLKNYVLDLVQNHVPIYVIALQEIWNLQCTDIVSIPGFRFIYQPRRVGRGGGVGFYIRDDIQFRELNLCQFVDSQFENIVIEATICKSKFIFANIYRAPSIQGNVSLRDLIEEYNHRLDELQSKLNSYHQYTSIIFSDCNINLLKLNTSQLFSEYLDTAHMNGFIQTNLKATRLNPTSYSLIDHIMTNNVTNDIKSGTIVCDLSDHFPVFFSCTMIKNQSNKKCNMTRAFTLANKERFRDELRSIRWHNVTSETDVNNALKNFLDIFLTLFDLHIPVIKQKVNRNRVKIKDFD
jgi:hypothetical protein